MQEVPKNLIGQSGKAFVQSLLMREGLTVHPGKAGIDLVVKLTKPRREFWVFVVSNLRPKRAGGKGKSALDWWIPKKTEADLIATVDLSELRAWLFDAEELPRYAQQQSAAKYHLYMYTEPGVALRGKKSMKFDYEFEGFKLVNRIYQGILEKRPRKKPKEKPARKARAKRRRARAAKAKRAARAKGPKVRRRPKGAAAPKAAKRAVRAQAGAVRKARPKVRRVSKTRRIPKGRRAPKAKPPAA